MDIALFFLRYLYSIFFLALLILDIKKLLLVGDGPGYDIKSFNSDGSFRYIEVKTTRGGINTGFFMSSSELTKSRIIEGYYLYRVYDYKPDYNTGKVYITSGPVEKSFNIAPNNFIVKGMAQAGRGSYLYVDGNIKNKIKY